MTSAQIERERQEGGRATGGVIEIETERGRARGGGIEIDRNGERERERQMAHGKFDQHIKIKFRNVVVPHVTGPNPASPEFTIGDLGGNFDLYSEIVGFFLLGSTRRGGGEIIHLYLSSFSLE